MVDVQTQLTEITRGVVDLHVRAELEERIKSGKPLRVKAGFDPTRPDLHLGHVVLLQKMRQFQDLGHEVTFLIGDFTAMVGDPTGQKKERPQLTRDAVRAAAETYVAQVKKVLDGATLKVRYNTEWLDAMTPMDLVHLMAKSTLSRMLERNDFKQRFEDDKPIHQHEFIYPLLQGYDSVALECDIELGGADQLFNLLVGRDLMPKYGKRAQIVMTTPLLEGIDAKMVDGEVVGAKMSKSADNYVGIDEAADEQYRKIMLVDDQVIWRYFELLSRRTSEAIAALKKDVAAGKHPKDIKKIFAHEIAERFHGKESAEAAARAWSAKFEKDAVPDEMPHVVVESDKDSLWLGRALADAKLVASSSQGKQLLEQGGVEVDGKRVDDGKFALAVGGTYVVRVGSKNRKFARIEVKKRG
jgi:tyrosyl-tRNA synthetase